MSSPLSWRLNVVLATDALSQACEPVVVIAGLPNSAKVVEMDQGTQN